MNPSMLFHKGGSQEGDWLTFNEKKRRRKKKRKKKRKGT